MVSNDEVDKPIRAGAGWLSMHPEKAIMGPSRDIMLEPVARGIRSTIVRLGLMDARGPAGDPARYVRLLDLTTHGCSVFSRLGPGRLD